MPRNDTQKMRRGFALLVLLAAAALLFALAASASSSKSSPAASSSSSSLLWIREKEMAQNSHSDTQPWSIKAGSCAFPRRHLKLRITCDHYPVRLDILPSSLEASKPTAPMCTCSASRRPACAWRLPWPPAARGPAAPSPPGNSLPALIMDALGGAPPGPCTKPHPTHQRTA